MQKEFLSFVVVSVCRILYDLHYFIDCMTFIYLTTIFFIFQSLTLFDYVTLTTKWNIKQYITLNVVPLRGIQTVKRAIRVDNLITEWEKYILTILMDKLDFRRIFNSHRLGIVPCSLMDSLTVYYCLKLMETVHGKRLRFDLFQLFLDRIVTLREYLGLI